MVEKIILLLTLYAAIFVYDGPKLNHKNGRERFAYGLLMTASLYLSIDYLLEQHFPNLVDVVHFFFKESAKHIVEAIKLPS